MKVQEVFVAVQFKEHENENRRDKDEKEQGGESSVKQLRK